jgi:hypothetical protein
VYFDDKKGLKFTLKTFLAAKYTKSGSLKALKRVLSVFVNILVDR